MRTRRGAGARGALVALLDDQTQPAIVRASAIDAAGESAYAVKHRCVVRALKDDDASVRQAAVEALGNVDVELRQRFLPLLDDAVLSVRIEAARSLAGAPEQGSLRGSALAFARRSTNTSLCRRTWPIVPKAI